jgi:hypothetical protein
MKPPGAIVDPGTIQDLAHARAGGVRHRARYHLPNLRTGKPANRYAASRRMGSFPIGSMRIGRSFERPLARAEQIRSQQQRQRG